MKRSSWLYALRATLGNSASRHAHGANDDLSPLAGQRSNRSKSAPCWRCSPSTARSNTNSPGDGLVTLREAIIAANTNTGTDLGHTASGADTIQFDPVVFAAAKVIPITFGELIIAEQLTINGPGRDLLTINAQQQSRVFNITATIGDFTIRGLTLTDGNATDGGGAIRSLRPLTLEQSTITGNRSAGNGGGVYSKSSLTLNHCAISGNSTTGTNAQGGGVFAFALAVTDSLINGNTSSGSGGGFAAEHGLQADLTISNSTISGNSASAAGGGFSVRNNVVISNSTLRDNSSGSTGGGFVFLPPTQAPPNSISYGPRATITDSTIAGNNAVGSGGGFYGAPTVVMTRSNVTGNKSQANGGGFSAQAATRSARYLTGYVKIVDATISGNQAQRRGRLLGRLQKHAAQLHHYQQCWRRHLFSIRWKSRKVHGNKQHRHWIGGRYCFEGCSPRSIPETLAC